MPKQRIQVDPGSGIPNVGLTTPAQVQDTFIRPGAAPDQGAQVLDALSGLAPGLERLSSTLFTAGQAKTSAANKEQQLAGEQAARDLVQGLDASRKTYADAVEQGRIPALGNPFMKQGYYEELGRTYAGKYNADLLAAVGQDEKLADSVEVGDFRKFAADFESHWKMNNLPDDVNNSAFQVGFGARRDAYLQNAETGFAAQAGDRFQKRTVTMFRDEAVQYIADALDQTQTPAQIGANLRKMWDDKHALGWSAPAMRQALIDAAGDAALQRKDPTLMQKILSAVPDGDGRGKANLANTDYAIKLDDNLAGNIAEARNRQHQEWTQAKATISESINGEAQMRFLDATKQNVPPQQFDLTDLAARAVQNGDAQLAEHLTTLQRAYKNPEFQDNPDTVAALYVKLHRGPYVLQAAEMNQALNNHQITPVTYNSIFNELTQAQKSAREEARQGPPEDKLRDFALSTLKSGFSKGAFSETDQVIARREVASTEMELWYHDYFKAPNAPGAKLSEEQQRLAIRDHAAQLTAARMPTIGALMEGSGDIFSLRPQERDWSKTPIDTPKNLPTVIQNVEDVLHGRGTLTAQTAALLGIYRLDGAGMAPAQYLTQLQDFVNAQRKFLPRNNP